MGKKKEFVIEYDFQSSPQLLFQYLSTPSGLSEWFSDDVNYRGEKYTFFWGESEEYARVLSKKIKDKIENVSNWREFFYSAIEDEFFKDKFNIYILSY